MTDKARRSSQLRLVALSGLSEDVAIMISPGAVVDRQLACPECGGTGRVPVSVEPNISFFAIMHGLSLPLDTRCCDTCAGRGYVARSLEVVNPRGVGIIKGLSRL